MGRDTTEVIAAVIKDDLALDRLPPDVPAAIRRLLARCLERDPRQRLRDIGEARILLADPASMATSPMAQPPGRGRSRASWLGWAALALMLAGAAGAAAWRLTPGPELPLRRIDLADPLASSNGLALAPDGSRIAYFSGAHLYVRALDALAPQDLGARSRHVRAAVLVAGRTHDRVLCRRRDQYDPGRRRTGAAGLQNPGDRAPARLRVAAGRDDPLYRPRDSVYTVPAAGGTPAVYLAIDSKTEVEFASVSPLPDNRLIVTTRIREPPSFRTELVGSGSDRRRTTIVADPDVTFVKYDPHGLLLFRRRGRTAVSGPRHSMRRAWIWRGRWRLRLAARIFRRTRPAPRLSVSRRRWRRRSWCG